MGGPWQPVPNGPLKNTPKILLKIKCGIILYNTLTVLYCHRILSRVRGSIIPEFYQKLEEPLGPPCARGPYRALNRALGPQLNVGMCRYSKRNMLF